VNSISACQVGLDQTLVPLLDGLLAFLEKLLRFEIQGIAAIPSFLKREFHFGLSDRIGSHHTLLPWLDGLLASLEKLLRFEIQGQVGLHSQLPGGLQSPWVPDSMHRNDRILPEDPPPDPLPPEALHQQRTSVFFQSSCLLPPPADESDGTTSGVSDGTSAGFQPERPPPLFRLDEEEIFSQHSSSSVHPPSSSSFLDPHTTTNQVAKYYRHSPPYQQQPQADASQTSYIGEGSFSQSYETASYPGLKILVPRLGFQEDLDDVAADAPTVLGSKSPNEESGSILSTLSNEESIDGRLFSGVNNRILALWIGGLTLLIFAALAMVGTTCAMDQCKWRPSSNGGNNTDPVNIDGPIAAPGSPPVTQNPTTARPLETAEMLMEAVDLYLDALPATSISKVSSMYGYPIGKWDVSRVDDFSRLFDTRRNPQAAMFQDDLSGWDTRRATNMSFMFRGAVLFNGNVTAFDTKSVVSADSMFDGALSFDQDVSDWNVNKIGTANRMFRDAISFQGNGLDRWDLQSVEKVEEMVR
jgi:hypothetical protein